MRAEGTWSRALLWFAFGLIVGVVGAFLLRPEPAEATFEINVPVICHHTPGNEVTKRFSSWRAYLGHIGQPHSGRTYDTQGECPAPTPTPTPEPEPTTRMCHWNGEGFDAIAVAETARTRHFNAHKLDKDWVEGMDADCEFEPEPTPEPTPAPQPVVREHGPAGFTPACYGQTHPVIPWASAIRNGSDATINYVPTTGEGDFVNVVFSENPFDIIFNLGAHGLRDERPNDGSVELHELVVGQSYWFRIANGCARWSGIFFIPAN